MNTPRTRRRRGATTGLLVVLLLALATCGYRVAFSPSASTGPGKDRPTANATADVLAPQAPQTPAPSTPGPSGTGSGTGGSTGISVVLAPAVSNGTGHGGGTVNCVDPSSEAGNCDHRFGVAVGQAPTLYPGMTRMLPVAYTNPNQFDIFVTTYRVSVSVPPAQATTCPAANLEVPAGTVTLAPRLTAAKKGSVSTTIPIRLAASAPDGCQQASFLVTVNASAVKK